VDFGGLPAPVAALRAALPDDVVVIEDAAHALGARRADGPVGDGRHADMTMFSFHPVKPVTTGEGGVITTRDATLRDRLRSFRSHGMTKDPALLERPDEGGWYMEQQELGYNYRITDLQSALGVAQMARLDRFITARNAIAARYRDELADLDDVELPPAAGPGERHGYHLFAIRLRGGSAQRRRVYDGLRERGVSAQVHYLPVYRHPWYRQTYADLIPGLCPEAERHYACCLSLPCFPSLADADQTAVVAALQDVMAENRPQ
jgi:dTDP-4-amino-4,6-dideoxygalactose transaminase